MEILVNVNHILLLNAIIKKNDSLLDTVRYNSHEINSRCLIALKAAESLRKLYCLARSTFLGVLAQAWRLRDAKAKVKSQGSRKQKQKEVGSRVQVGRS